MDPSGHVWSRVFSSSIRLLTDRPPVNRAVLILFGILNGIQSESLSVFVCLFFVVAVVVVVWSGHST